MSMMRRTTFAWGPIALLCFAALLPQCGSDEPEIAILSTGMVETSVLTIQIAFADSVTAVTVDSVGARFGLRPCPPTDWVAPPGSDHFSFPKSGRVLSYQLLVDEEQHPVAPDSSGSAKVYVRELADRLESCYPDLIEHAYASECFGSSWRDLWRGVCGEVEGGDS